MCSFLWLTVLPRGWSLHWSWAFHLHSPELLLAASCLCHTFLKGKLVWNIPIIWYVGVGCVGNVLGSNLGSERLSHTPEAPKSCGRASATETGQRFPLPGTDINTSANHSPVALHVAFSQICQPLHLQLNLDGIIQILEVIKNLNCKLARTRFHCSVHSSVEVSLFLPFKTFPVVQMVLYGNLQSLSLSVSA